MVDCSRALIYSDPQNVATVIFLAGSDENVINLECFNGVYRKLEAHEDIHNPEYFEALKEYERSRNFQRQSSDYGKS